MWRVVVVVVVVVVAAAGVVVVVVVVVATGCWLLFLTIELNAEGDSSQQQQQQQQQQQSHRAAAMDRYALSRPLLRRADALRNVPLDVSASTLTSQGSAATREPADPLSGGITLTGMIHRFCYTSQCIGLSG